MIDLKDFMVRETLRKTPRYKGETNKNKYFRCKCPNCDSDIGYISKSVYNKKNSCNNCSTIKRSKLKENHWSKNGGKPWNKGKTTPEQQLKNKLRNNLRSRLNKALKGGYKIGSAIGDLGCTIEELKAHLESQFQEGMTWDNWSKDGWHIDHIKPLASFDLADEEDLKKACHYTNLQPLWAKDNLSKGNKVISDIIFNEYISEE